MSPEHIPLPFDLRCIPDMHAVAFAQHNKMHSFAWLHTPGERSEKLSRRELATALFMQRACHAYYPVLDALERIQVLLRDHAGATPLSAELAPLVAQALDAARPATPQAIAATLDDERLPGVGGIPGAGNGRPGTARRVANLLGRLWRDGAVPAREEPQVRLAHQDMLALLDAAAAGRQALAAPAEEAQLVPVSIQGRTEWLPVVHQDTPTFQVIVEPGKAALLATPDPDGDRVYIGATSVAEAVGVVLMANPALRYADVLEHLEV